MLGLGGLLGKATPHRSTIVALVPLTLLAVACGGAGGTTRTASTVHSSAGAAETLLTSVERTASQSFLVDMTVTSSFSSTGQSGAQFGALTAAPTVVSVHLAAESLQRLRVTMSTTFAGQAIHVVVIRYDGSSYISKDGGATFKVVPAVGAVPQDFSSLNALTYLQSVGPVTDEGPGTADGVAVERYSAQLDPAKIIALIKGQLSTAQGAAVQKIFDSLTFKSGAIHVTVDHQGRIVSVNGPIDVSIDLGAIGAGHSGTLDIHETIDAHFHDYGTSVRVPKPSVS